MATIRKRGQSRQAQVKRQGHPPITNSFQQKSDVQQWAKEMEVSLQRGDAGIVVTTQTSAPLTISQILLDDHFVERLELAHNIRTRQGDHRNARLRLWNSAVRQAGV